MKKLLLGSGGIRTEERMSAWKTEAADFLKGTDSVLFIPFAGKDYDAYHRRTVELDLHPGKEVMGIHTYPDALKAVEDAECISVGGGNTFRLLTHMQRRGLMQAVREKVLAGTPYVGISAGSNLACPSIKTTNDMPIMTPSGLEGLGLLPIQINPHYFPGAIHYYEGEKLERYAGETREDRIREFHEENNLPVLGMFEGSILRVEDSTMILKGVGSARLFQAQRPPKVVRPGERLTIV